MAEFLFGWSRVFQSEEKRGGRVASKPTVVRARALGWTAQGDLKSDLPSGHRAKLPIVVCGFLFAPQEVRDAGEERLGGCQPSKMPREKGAMHC